MLSGNMTVKNRPCRKFIITVIVFFCALLLISAPRTAKTFSKITAFRYVQAHQTELCEIAAGIISGETETPYQYNDYTAHYYKAASVKEPVVEFYVHSFGIAPSGFYAGFYYSPKDIPVRFQGAGTAMEPHKNGKAWVYDETGDNHGYTEKICNNWYWFEFYF